jgi:hypothetical protein
MNGHDTRRETTSHMLTQILQNRHASLTQWALNNYAAWQRHKDDQVIDSLQWHIAEVELAYWAAVLEMLKDRAS